MKVWPRERKFVKFSSSWRGIRVIRVRVIEVQYCNTLSKVQTLHSWLRKKSFFQSVCPLVINTQQRPLENCLLRDFTLATTYSPSSLSSSFFYKIIMLSYIQHTNEGNAFGYFEQAWPVRNSCSVLNRDQNSYWSILKSWFFSLILVTHAQFVLRDCIIQIMI